MLNWTEMCFSDLFWIIGQCKIIVSNSIRTHHLPSLLSKCSKQFKLLNHRFKQHHNAPFSVLASNLFLSSSNFTNIVSNSVRMHITIFIFKTIFSYSVRIRHLLSLLSTCYHHLQLPKASFKMRKNGTF